ncbi:MAG: efflux RND transporter periplasmic adaptor subunit [Frankiales bacterium]|nr:efflux RND transporter periplasmic adaptor subunit [Frankiales bacterium]
MKRLVLPALAVLALAGCSSGGDLRVQTAAVTRADVAEVVDAPGAVAARAVSSLTAPSAATVDAVLVKDGATVSKGAVLARLSNPAAQDRLRQALAAQAAASGAAVTVPRADLSPVQDALDAAARQSFTAGRAAAAQISDPDRRRQAEQQVAQAEQQYADASSAARTALAQVNSGANGVQQALAAVAGSQRAQAGAAVDVARAAVDALTVRAPIAGVVTFGAGGGGSAPAGGDLAGLIAGLPAAVQGQASAALGASGAAAPATVTQGLLPGSRVAAGAPLATVTDLGGLSVTAEVDETDVLLVKPGTTAKIEVDAVPDASYPATVQAIDVAPTASAGGGVTYRVRLALAAGTLADGGAAPRPRPGMSAVVNLQVRSAKQALSVPSASIVRDGGRDAVFVVESGRAVRRDVRLGAQGADVVEVLAGLDQGARVVVRDADRLRDGQAVTS